jgi:polysaccharide biosynthesis/export protein
MSIRLRFFPLLAVVVLAASGCAAGVQGPFVWAATLAPEPERQVYRVSEGDELRLQVWDNEPLSVTARVRSDGTFVVPLIGQLRVAGLTADSVARMVESRLTQAQLVISPRVTVIADETVAVSVLGKVARAGTYPLGTARGVADALAAAGGLSEFAREDQLFVLRQMPTPTRIRFRFRELFDPTNTASRFRLRSGDVVFVD